MMAEPVCRTCPWPAVCVTMSQCGRPGGDVNESAAADLTPHAGDAGHDTDDQIGGCDR